MDQWGVDGCRERIDLIVADILPRAKAWVAQNRPWIHLLLPSGIEDAAIRSSLRGDVLTAIAESEKLAAEAAESKKKSLTCSRENQGAVHHLPYGGPVIRHLAYHIWPLAENETWRINLDQLIQRMPLFNGRRRIGIAVSSNGRTDPPEAVKEYLKDFDCEFVEVANRDRMGEVATFLPLLEPLASTDPNVLIFRAHAKGVRHGAYDPAHPVHRWTKMSYDALFDYPEIVEQQLLDHAFTGPFRRIGMFRTMGKDRSHYSGTFYAFRSAFVFSKYNWRSIRARYYGCESWPGQHWRAEEHACIFGDGCGNLYRENELKPLEEEFERWKASRSASSLTTTAAT